MEIINKTDILQHKREAENRKVTLFRHHKINGKEIKTKNEFGWLNPIKITYK